MFQIERLEYAIKLRPLAVYLITIITNNLPLHRQSLYTSHYLYMYILFFFYFSSKKAIPRIPNTNNFIITAQYKILKYHIL